MTLAVVLQVRDEALCVLLWERAREPFSGAWSLPGGYLEQGQSLEESIRTQLARKVDVAELSWLEQLETLGEPGRHPAEWQLATAYLGLVPLGLDPALPPDTAWHSVDHLPERLAFDHGAIVLAGRERLRAKLSYTNIGFALAPERFSISELSAIYSRRARLSGRPDQPAPRARAPRPARAHRRAARAGARGRPARGGLPLRGAGARGDRPVRGVQGRRLERVEQKADVQRRRRVRERPDADPVHAALGHRPDGLERDAARRLQLGAAGGQLHRAAQLAGRHVVEQKPRHAGVERPSHLLERRALDLDRHPGGRVRQRAPRRLGHPARQRGVVLLDEDRVVEPAAVVHAAARQHRLLLERAQARGGLARVEDAGAPCPRPPAT